MNPMVTGSNRLNLNITLCGASGNSNLSVNSSVNRNSNAGARGQTGTNTNSATSGNAGTCHDVFESALKEAQPGHIKHITIANAHIDSKSNER